MRTGSWESMTETDNSKDLGVEDRILLKYILKKYDGRAGLFWLRTNRSGGFL